MQCISSPANPSPKAVLWVIPVQNKADSDVTGESLLGERVNCIIFPTPTAKPALDGEKWGGMVLFFLCDVFPLHQKEELFSPSIFTSKLSLWNKLSAADSVKRPIWLLVGVLPNLWLQDLVTAPYEVILTHKMPSPLFMEGVAKAHVTPMLPQSSSFKSIQLSFCFKGGRENCECLS